MQSPSYFLQNSRPFYRECKTLPTTCPNGRPRYTFTSIGYLDFSSFFVPAQRVLAADLGADWRKNFREFNTTPFASASIGQVHSATLLDGRRVAVKIQFPGVADSIDADISNLKFLLTFSAILPKGLYLDNTLRVMRRELADECNYVREADCGRTFSRLLAGDRHLATPSVIDELCTPRVLTTGMMEGKPLSSSHGLSQETRDHVSISRTTVCFPTELR